MLSRAHALWPNELDVSARLESKLLGVLVAPGGGECGRGQRCERFGWMSIVPRKSSGQLQVVDSLKWLHVRVVAPWSPMIPCGSRPSPSHGILLTILQLVLNCTFVDVTPSDVDSNLDYCRWSISMPIGAGLVKC